jgi:hypothetical protein
MENLIYYLTLFIPSFCVKNVWQYHLFNDCILTPSGKIKRASTSIIMEWISKAWKKSVSQYYPKSVLKCSSSNAEHGLQDEILQDNSEQSGNGESSSENESANEGSLDELSD